MSSSEPYAQRQEQSQSQPAENCWQVRFLAMVKQSAEVFWLLTPAGELAEVSPSWQAFTGQSPDMAQGWGWLQAIHPMDHTQLEETLASVLLSAAPLSCSCHIYQANGLMHWVQLLMTPVQTCGRIREIVVTGKDLSSKARVNWMDEAQLQLALKASLVGMWDRDLRTNRLVWTEQCRTIFGLPPGAPVTFERFLSTIHPVDRERVIHTLEQSIANHTDFHTEFRAIWPDGSIHWLAGRGRGTYDPQNKPLHLTGATIEITDLKQTEEALAEIEGRFRRFVESNIIGITIDDLDGNIHEANDAFLKLVGYSRADLEAGLLRWTALTAPEYEAQNAQARDALLETGSFPPMEFEYLHKNGQHIPALVGGTLFRRGDPSTLGMCFIVDLTAHKTIEHQKDLFLSMASHELKTPLTALKGTLQLLQRHAQRLSDPTTLSTPQGQKFVGELTRRLTTALRQIDMQTRLINELLDISRITANALEITPGHHDLVSLVRETIEELRMTAPGRVLELMLPEQSVVPVLADRDRISQVVTNYVTNALRYAPAHEPISVGITLQGHMARVWVQDRGPGLSEEAQKSIWQCFHRVKSAPAHQACSEKGLGLGLYICQTLIAQHGGQVGVQSIPGEGATFWFTLPLLAQR